MALLALVLVSLLVTTPLPAVDQGTLTLAPGEVHAWNLHFPVGVHLTYIIEADRPVDVVLYGVSDRIEMLIDDHGVLKSHHYGRFDAGDYRLVVRASGDGPTEVRYQIHKDYELFGPLTARNLVALISMMAIVSLAVVLRFSRRS